MRLKACPFCGGEASTFTDGFGSGFYFGIGCETEGCFGASNGNHNTADYLQSDKEAREHVRAWNRRTPTPTEDR
jgi:hypothetical protein